MTNIDKIKEEFEEKFPVKPSLSDPDKLVIYSRNEWGLIEADLTDFWDFIQKKLEEAEKTNHIQQPVPELRKTGLQPAGNCPYCDAEMGRNSQWGMSQSGWQQTKEVHDKYHK